MTPSAATAEAPHAQPAALAQHRATDIHAVIRFMNLQQATRGVEGWLHPLEGYTLHLLAKHGTGDGGVVEVGSFKGLSTIWLASAMFPDAPPVKPGEAPPHVEPKGKVIAIDHFKGSPEHQKGQKFEVKEIAGGGTTYAIFDQNITKAGVKPAVHALVSDSLRAAKEWNKGPIRLVFLDGDHSYESSKADFEAWTPRVCKDGLVALHDIGVWEGVTKFYQEVAQSGGKIAGAEFREVAASGSLRVLQKM